MIVLLVLVYDSALRVSVWQRFLVLVYGSAFGVNVW
jgi:hypothetical protein